MSCSQIYRKHCGEKGENAGYQHLRKPRIPTPFCSLRTTLSIIGLRRWVTVHYRASNSL